MRRVLECVRPLSARFETHAAAHGRERVKRAASGVSRPRTLVMLVLLSGCAQTLPALSSGLDGARQVIAVSCPARTTPCERVLSAYNVGIVAYNNALLAQAVGEDASAFEQQGMAALKQLWAALMAAHP